MLGGNNSVSVYFKRVLFFSEVPIDKLPAALVTACEPPCIIGDLFTALKIRRILGRSVEIVNCLRKVLFLSVVLRYI